MVLNKHDKDFKRKCESLEGPQQREIEKVIDRGMRASTPPTGGDLRVQAGTPPRERIFTADRSHAHESSRPLDLDPSTLQETAVGDADHGEQNQLLRGYRFYVAPVFNNGKDRSDFFVGKISEMGGIAVREPSDGIDYLIVDKACEGKKEEQEIREKLNLCTGRKEVKSLRWISDMRNSKEWIDPLRECYVVTLSQNTMQPNAENLVNGGSMPPSSGETESESSSQMDERISRRSPWMERPQDDYQALLQEVYTLKRENKEIREELQKQATEVCSLKRQATEARQEFQSRVDSLKGQLIELREELHKRVRKD